MKTTLIALASLVALSGAALAYGNGYGTYGETRSSEGLHIKKKATAFDPFEASDDQRL